jgi:hypothetical protein
LLWDRERLRRLLRGNLPLEPLHAAVAELPEEGAVAEADVEQQMRCRQDQRLAWQTANPI